MHFDSSIDVETVSDAYTLAHSRQLNTNLTNMKLSARV